MNKKNHSFLAENVTLSLLAGKYFSNKTIALLKGTEKNSKKKLSLLAGKFLPRKKSLRF